MVGGLLAGVCYMPLMGVSIEVKQFYKVKTIAMCWRYIRYITYENFVRCIYNNYI